MVANKTGNCKKALEWTIIGASLVCDSPSPCSKEKFTFAQIAKTPWLLFTSKALRPSSLPVSGICLEILNEVLETCCFLRIKPFQVLAQKYASFEASQAIGKSQGDAADKEESLKDVLEENRSRGVVAI